MKGVFFMRKKNFIIQFNEIINSKIKIGMSRQDAKIDYRNRMKSLGEKPNNLKSDFIHSVKTADTYRESIIKFGKWIKLNQPEVWKSKDLKKVTREVSYIYLKEQESQGKSAWTISRDMASINKVLNLNLNKKEGHLKKRSLMDIKRSRTDSNTKLSKSVLDKNKNQIILAKATGVRRESITNLTPSSFIWHNGKVVAVRVEWIHDGKIHYEKGGRFRLAPVLKKYQTDIAKILKDKEPDKPIFQNYSRKVDNHSFRSGYAISRYKELVDLKSKYRKQIKNNYRNYDRDIIQAVSRNLGHNRLAVVVEHYLRNTKLQQ
jgi:hypothetical protein